MTAHPARALDGARAPQRWQNEIAAAAARQRALRIRSAWLTRLVQPPANLRDGPLFGTALADAVARLGGALGHADDDAARRRLAGGDAARARARPADATQFPKNAARATAPFAPPRSRARPAAASAFAHGAPPDAPAASPFAPTAQRGDAPAGAVASSRARRPEASPFADAADSPPSPRAAEPANRAVDGASATMPLTLARYAPQPLLDGLVRRARVAGPAPDAPHAQRVPAAPTARPQRGSRAAPLDAAPPLRRPALSPDVAPPGAAAFSGVPHAAFADTAMTATSSLRARVLERVHGRGPRAFSDFGGEPAIERDWSRSMVGPAAPLTLLAQLAAPRGVPASASRTARRDAPRASPNAGDAAQPAAIGALDPPFSDSPDAAVTKPSAADLATEPALPPFVWPRSPVEPALAVAAAAAAARAPAPPADAEHDLDLLSAKIERILAEQARRHGIDV